MHVLMILHSSCFIYLGMLRLTNIGIATIFATFKHLILVGFSNSEIIEK